MCFCAGCATASPYNYSEQKRFRDLSGCRFTCANFSSEGNCKIDILRVDEFSANFPAGSPNTPSWIYEKKPLYLSPGKHTLVLNIARLEVFYGDTGGGLTGVKLAPSSPVRSQRSPRNFPQVTYIDLPPILNGASIDLTLWDETGAPAISTRAARWTLASNANYSDSAAPTGNHR